MLTASMTLDPAFRVAPVHRRTFGSFVEHMGRCVYTGIYEPGHPAADADGFRTDVAALVRELGVTTVRYPGGNFVSGYRWEDGVGPKAERPVRRDLAWHSTETNQFGLDEFITWTRTLGIEPMMAVNLGTRGLQEALDLLEYANHPGGTALSDRRAANGHPQPHAVRMWCLGNEMDGPWQIGHKTAREYGRLAAEVARAMRMSDPGLELVACGSSGSSMPTFGAWEAEVLEETYDLVDYISLHAYYEEHDGDLASFLASATDMDHFIESVVATADAVRARLGATKRVNLSFDEWNVWYLSRHQAAEPRTDWPVAPRVIEDRYHLADAVVVGGLLISLLRHSDRVTAASLAQLVNVIAPIMTEPGGPAWRQTTFHPFALTAATAAGTVLRVEPESPVRETARYGAVPVVDAVATHDPEHGRAAVFVVNRAVDEPVTLHVDLRGLAAERVVSCRTLHDDDVYAANTAEHPDRVTPAENKDTALDGGRLSVVLPPVSWTVLTLEVPRA
ncbi:arabinosylfuranosidase ArfA [Streptomonospora nanhaiensis]|uniref:non-reducing end alpha-L-arabinofuranosidase n=1 Tax=Streptomonospora nanhaiensis TaxID=1323731 RepID=A0A853BKY3_9ACTN|nr:alpha-N-arabinofuranosidase [Streptomonospora nanhaiensis]MBV2363018.1 alpha-N-arabinofuranosidase [Streptomonospora nanhaiensis]NYI95385.1 alpha-N-arabinofuranosidase [Streptomonospora nanhaiensis]